MERTLWMPLRDRNVRLLIASTGLSQTGDWLYNVALIVLVLERTGSGTWIAAAGIVRLLPYVVFGTIGGNGPPSGRARGHRASDRQVESPSPPGPPPEPPLPDTTPPLPVPDPPPEPPGPLATG